MPKAIPKTDEYPHKEFGVRFRKWIKDKFGTLYKASKTIKYADGRPFALNTLYSYATGRRLPNVTNQNIFRRYGADWEYLATGDSKYHAKVKDPDADRLLTFLLEKPPTSDRRRLLLNIVDELSELDDRQVLRLLNFVRSMQK